jgi:hypothetical protein
LYPSGMRQFVKGIDKNESRWSTLNDKTMQKTAEINAHPKGRRRLLPIQDLEEIKRKLQVTDERKQFLEGPDYGQQVMDSYDAYYSVKKDWERNNGDVQKNRVPRY